MVNEPLLDEFGLSEDQTEEKERNFLQENPEFFLPSSKPEAPELDGIQCREKAD